MRGDACQQGVTEHFTCLSPNFATATTDWVESNVWNSHNTHQSHRNGYHRNGCVNAPAHGKKHTWFGLWYTATARVVKYHDDSCDHTSHMLMHLWVDMKSHIEGWRPSPARTARPVRIRWHWNHASTQGCDEALHTPLQPAHMVKGCVSESCSCLWILEACVLNSVVKFRLRKGSNSSSLSQKANKNKKWSWSWSSQILYLVHTPFRVEGWWGLWKKG